jgi:hypothetical protein
MSFESVLTFVGIIIAILALIPRAKFLAIKIRIKWFDVLVMISCGMVVVYLLFYPTFRVIGYTPAMGLSTWRITPENTIFIILIITSIYLYLRLKFSTFSIRRIDRVNSLVNNLLQEEKYGDLIEFLEQNFVRLKDISERATPYLILVDKVKPNWKNILVFFQEEEPPSTLKKILNMSKEFPSKLLIPLRLLPSFYKSSEGAFETLKNMVLNESFIDYIVKSHSYIFIKFLDLNNDEFTDLILRKLIADRRSILFIELKNSQNLEGYCNYDLPESNKLLYYLFHDPKRADALGVWQPIGEYTIEKLAYLERHPELDDFNTDVQNYYETGRWNTDIFIAIHFFHLMVSRALYGNIDWHMWLFYYRFFIEGIIKNHRNSDKYYNPYAEWPTKYEYLIYQMFSNMCHWLYSLGEDKIELSQKNVKINSKNLKYDYGNIPVSTMITIGECLKILHSAGSVSDSFKYYIFSLVFRLYFDLRRRNDLKDYSRFFAQALFGVNNNIIGDLTEYHAFIEETFNVHFDQFPIDRELIQEFQQIIATRAESTLL